MSLLPLGKTAIGSGSAVAFARIFSLICAATQLPLLTRVLDPDEYARIAVAIVVATFFSLISAEPAILGFQRFPGTDGNRANYAFAITRMSVAVAVASVVAVGVGFILGRGLDTTALIGWGIGIAVNRIVSCGWLMWGRPWKYAWNLVAGTGARTLVLIALLLAGWDPLVSLALAGLVSAGAALLFSPRFRLSRETWMSKPWPTGFGIQLAFASLAFTLLTNGSLLFLGAFSSAEAVGKYAAMTQAAALTSGAVMGLILTVAFPRLRLRWDEGARNRVQGDAVLLHLLCVSVASITIFATHVANFSLLRLVVSDRYVDGSVLAPLIIATALASMGLIASWNHQFKLAAGYIARGAGYSALAGIALTLVFTVIFGERGAAMGCVLGFLIYFCVMTTPTRLPLKAVVVIVLSLAFAIGPLVAPLPGDLIAYSALTLAAIVCVVVVRSVNERRTI